MTIKPTDETLLGDVQQLYELHQQQADKYAKILQILKNGAVGGDFSISIQDSVSVNDKVKRGIRKGGTFESRVLDMLANGVPMSVREIRAELNKMGFNQYTNKNVSTQLRLVKKNKKNINNQLFPEYSMDFRNIWGLSEWVENGKFRQSFLDKIAQKAK